MGLFRNGEPILRIYIVYICICFFSFLSLLSLHLILEHRVEQFSRQEANEQVKNTISLFVQKRILMIQNQFQYMMLASSRAELELADQTVSDNIERVRKAILVLEKGGRLKETFFVNFGNRENIDQTLTYIAPDSERISLSAIEMKTNLTRLEESRQNYLEMVQTRMEGPMPGAREGHTEELALYHKTIAPFFQRVIENSNRLYFESLNALNRARQDRLSQAGLYHTVGGGISFMALAAILGFGVWIIRGIMAILDERKAARNALVATNENLETLVLERTDSLRAEVAERKKTEQEMTRQARFLTTVIESLNHPFYVIDLATHEIMIANRAALAGRAGRTDRDSGKITCFELTHRRETPCDGKEHPCPIHLIQETRAPVVTEHVHYDEEGTPRNVEVYGYPIFDDTGRIIQIIEYTLDITEKKNAQTALKKSRDELEETVIRRTRTLELEIEKRRQYQAELEQSEQHFRKLIRNINDIILIVGESGNIELVSHSVQHVLGWDPEEITGRPVFDFIHPEEFREPGPKLENFIRFARQTRQAEHRIRHRNGTYRIMESSLRFMVHDPDIRGIIFTSRDITDRKKNEEMQKKLLLAVEQNPNTVVITDTRGTIEYVNPAFEINSGYSAQEAIGQNPRILNSGKVDPARFREMWETLTRGEIWKGEFINRKKSGALYTENVVMVPLKDDGGAITHFVSIKENITELIQAREQAEAATRAKSEFLANMSHEIRTPMNAIIGMSHLALATDLTPKQHDYVRKIHISANSLLELINSLLDFSKIEAGRLELEQTGFSILTPIHQVRDMIAVHARDKRRVRIRIAVDPDIPLRVVGDPLRLKQVLLNLFSNAVKFTHEGEIRLDVDLAGREGDAAVVRFSVQDTGIGISEAQMQTLFQAFSQADASTTRQYGGTGLGLTICKRLIRLMGGEIRVESTPGRGSRFWFDLSMKIDNAEPLGPDRLLDLAAGLEPGSLSRLPDIAPRKLAPDWLKPVRGARILLAEDNEINQDFARELLQRAGFYVVIADNGQAAVTQACNDGESRFDAVLMDIQMPVMDGYQAAQEIRKQFSPEQLPIIAMSASILEQDRQKAEEAGMNDYISKPIDIPSLFRALVKWILPGERLLPKAVTPGEAAGPDNAIPGQGPVRMEKGLERTGGNVALYHRILSRFMEKRRTTVQELGRLLETGAGDEAGQMVHEIKGEAGNISAEELYHAAVELEICIADANDTTQAMNGFQTAMDRTLEFVARTVPQPETSAPAAQKSDADPRDRTGQDAAQLKTDLESLVPLLRQGNLSKIRGAAKTLNPEAWPESLAGEISDLKALLSRYRYRDALEKVLAVLDNGRIKETPHE